MGIKIRRSAEARWYGSEAEGTGRIGVGSGAIDTPYSLRSRVEDEAQTNPEELIAAGHAGCFAMSLASLLGEEGYEPAMVAAKGVLTLEQTDNGWSVTRIELDTIADVPGIDEETFARLAEQAKATCPISRALAAIAEITLVTSLASAEAA